ncbi:hypothetical protein [Actinoplanes sp. NPDC020271]|uniref:hypothetical protein n=1 Tax=Actinoplanes sp. NPDC020271 TaxID=3363896 RepID=UPI0037A199A4
MTAETIGYGRWSPDPIRQRLATLSLEDVLNLPDDTPRIELRDGTTIAVPAPTFGHDHAYELVNGRYELVADSDTELVLSASFDIALPIRDIAP